MDQKCFNQIHEHSKNGVRSKQTNAKQLDKVYHVLTKKAEDIHDVLIIKLREEHRESYLKSWLQLVELPEPIQQYFLKHVV